jgi:hypothetical protein
MRAPGLSKPTFVEMMKRLEGGKRGIGYLTPMEFRAKHMTNNNQIGAVAL